MSDERGHDPFAAALREAPPLSAAGGARREQLRAQLLHAVDRRRRARRALRLAGAAVVVAALAYAFARREEAPPVPDHVALSSPGPEPTLPRLRHAHLQVVHDSDAALARWLVQPPPPAGVHVDDRELLRLLRAAGRPTGLVRSGGHVLLTAAVVDPLGGR